jgi:hypothetical protein
MANTMTQLKQQAKQCTDSSVNRVRVAVTNNRYRSLCSASIRRLPSRDRKRFDLKTIEQCNQDRSRKNGADYDLTVVVSSLEAQLVQSFKKMALGINVKYVLFPEDLPVEAIPDKLMMLKVNCSKVAFSSRKIK